jgi:hypothetical protein
MDKFKSGQIMENSSKYKSFCCLHKNLVPLEFSFARKTWPEGYEKEPFYSSVNILGADVIRVKSYLCLDCNREIKAPNPESIQKDRL